MRQLTQADIDMVFQAAKNFARKHTIVQWEDYVTSGYIGLTEAAKTWNQTFGSSFKRHAWRRMQGAMLDQYRKEYGRTQSSRSGREESHKMRGLSATESIGEGEFTSVEPINAVDERDSISHMTRGLGASDRMICGMLAEGIPFRDVACSVGLGEIGLYRRRRERIAPHIKRKLQGG